MFKNLEMQDKGLEVRRFNIDHLLEIEAYYEMEKRINLLNDNIKQFVLKPKHVVPYFQPGRLLKVF